MTRPTSIALATSAGLVTLAAVVAQIGPPGPARVAAQASPAPNLPPAPGGPEVVDAATAFLATLTEAQRAAAQVELKADLAAQWSNFPDGVVPRNGVFFRDLKPEQVAAALKVAKLALTEEGFRRFEEVRASDDFHDQAGGGPGGGPGGPGGPQGKGGGPMGKGGNPMGKGGGPQGKGGGPMGKGGGPQGKGGGPGGGGGVRFGSTHYMIAMLGQPSKTAPWMLQLGGHHLAFNIYYKGGVGASPPYFLGVEPLTWKDKDGKAHAPLAPMRDAVHGLVNSLSPEQLKRARLEDRFNDVYVGPGRDGQFPAREGVPVAELSDASKAFVRRAIATWTGDLPQGSDYRKLYDAELDRTAVAYSGDPSLTNVGDYVRIDGPHVWIEFSCQRGIHYHTIWRDRVTDYGAEFSF